MEGHFVEPLELTILIVDDWPDAENWFPPNSPSDQPGRIAAVFPTTRGAFIMTSTKATKGIEIGNTRVKKTTKKPAAKKPETGKIDLSHYESCALDWLFLVHGKSKSLKDMKKDVEAWLESIEKIISKHGSDHDLGDFDFPESSLKKTIQRQ